MMDSLEKQALFERIVSENARRIHYIARNSTSPDNLKDLEQEILLALWKSLDGFKGLSSLTTWAYGVAINVARLYRRNNNRPETAVGTFSDNAPATCNDASDRDPADLVEEFLPSLSMLDRFVFLMYLDDRSYREISETTGIAEANLRVRMSRIKQQFTQRYIGH
jgi:RNA polymerase sigma-70 factor (ECF subfamily)